MKSGGKDGTSKNKVKQGGTRTPDRDTVDEAALEEMGYSKEEEYVYYMLAPPWARHRDPILYLQQF